MAQWKVLACATLELWVQVMLPMEEGEKKDWLHQKEANQQEKKVETLIRSMHTKNCEPNTMKLFFSTL